MLSEPPNHVHEPLTDHGMLTKPIGHQHHCCNEIQKHDTHLLCVFETSGSKKILRFPPNVEMEDLLPCYPGSAPSVTCDIPKPSLQKRSRQLQQSRFSPTNSLPTVLRRKQQTKDEGTKSLLFFGSSRWVLILQLFSLSMPGAQYALISLSCSSISCFSSPWLSVLCSKQLAGSHVIMPFPTFDPNHHLHIYQTVNFAFALVLP